ncbi:MAG TPA: hypothetical protein VH062_01190 [Polyangiaceae bacterium]|nr:hypothetical protein [Polyangiaceae bacterium]
MLTVAPGHRDDLWADGYEFSVCVLITRAALRADREGDLVTRPAFVGRTAENVTRHQHERGVVIEPSAAAPELAHGLPEERQRFGRNFEPKNVASRIRPPRGGGFVAGALTGHELFQLVHGLATSNVQPCGLGFCDRHARELTRSGPVQHAGRERLRDGRQLFERFSHAELLLRGAWLVSEQTLDVFAEATVPEVHMRRRAQRGEKPTAFFRVRRSALASQERQHFVRSNPFTFLAGIVVRFHVGARHTQALAC